MADSISIEETNKIRAALGFKPLPVPGAGPSFKNSDANGSSSDEEDLGSTLESRQGAAVDNWKKLQEEKEAKARREARLEATKKLRDASRRFTKLEGKGLGEADGDTELDTKTWLLQQKKRQRKLAKKMERELAEREQETLAEHKAEDLAGVKVAHEIGDFEAGTEQVLTLKDTTIETNEEEGDELENLELKERERLNEKLELKKKKPVYNPNDIDDDAPTSILHQYDEEIDGKKQKRFTLDGQGSTAEERLAMKEDVKERLKAKPITLDILSKSLIMFIASLGYFLTRAEDAPTSDYLDISGVKIRKLKKKAKSTRKKAADEDDIFPVIDTTNGTHEAGEAMEVDSGNAVTSPAAGKKRSFEDTSFVDDDDLQASLARQRRDALKKRKHLKPEDIARHLLEEASATPDSGAANGATPDQEDVGLVIDETSEFVANLQKPTIPDRKRRSLSRGAAATAYSPPDVDGEGDINMNRSYNDIEDDEDLKSRIDRDSSVPASADITSTGLEAEATLNKGVGATLAMLSQRGLIKPSDSGNLNTLHRERQKFLAEKQRREAEAERKARLQRERDRASGKLDRMSAREREEHARWENKHRDQAESRQMADIFNREYKPDVELKYVDEFGRSMNQKEAFKHLSHQFHGKGSGKQKTEKRLKKIEDEKKREAMSSLDSSQSTGMNSAMGATARKNRQAGVRLA
jgi:U4/U6.U5 tri-snRNP-associated protein 1